MTRRPNVERSAETRGRVLAATVEGLNRLGYAGVTTSLVGSLSGVSRGALTHHFRSKGDLMIATAEHCLAAIGDQLSAPEAGDLAYGAGLMSAAGGAHGIALTEILLASRGDPSLSKAIRPIVGAIEAMQHRHAIALAERAGGDIVQLDALIWTMTSAARGAALTKLMGISPALVDWAFEVLDCTRLVALRRTER